MKNANILKTLKKPSEKKIQQKVTISLDKASIEISNSFTTVEGFSSEMLRLVKNATSYENENADQEIGSKYRLLKMAHSKGQHKWVARIKHEIKHLEDNKVVCLFKDFKFPTGLLSIVKDALKGLKYKERDLRVRPEPYHVLRYKNPQHKLRYYQKEAVQEALKQGRGVLSLSVGAGKSFIMQEIIRELGVTALIIVPATGLMEQLYRGLTEAFGEDKVETLSTAIIKKGGRRKPVQLITIQSLASLQKQGLVSEVLSHIDAIHLEEFHHSASTSYTNLMKCIDHIYFRFGYSGTNERADNKTLDLKGVLSNKLYEYPSYKAIEEGFLTPVQLKVYSLQGVSGYNYQKEYKNNYEGSEELVSWVSEIVESVDSQNQILILIDRKSGCGDVLYKALSEQGVELSYISGNDKKDVIMDSIEAFNDKKIKVLIGSNVIGEGIDLKTTDHLILARGGKSSIQVTQAIGRAVRLSEGKTIATIHDACFEGTKWLSKHCEIRIDLFKERFKGKISYE